MRLSANVCFAACVLVLAAVRSPLYADSGVTVGVTLSRLTEQVNAAVTAASAAGNAAGMEAGRDLALAISSTQNVYEEDLNKQLSGKVPPALKATVDQLQNAINQLATMTKASLQVASTSAEQISNSLPYRPQEPKLVRFTPRFLVPAKDTYLVKMKFTGAFDFASKAEFFPTLMIHEHAYKPVASSATELEFGVPINEIFPAGTSSAKQLQSVNGTLKVPWQTSSLMGKKHTKKEDSFRLVMAALPSGPGIVKYMAKATRLEGGKPQSHTSPPFHQCSTRSCGGGDDINHLWSEKPDAGCAIKQGTSSLNVTQSSGEWKKQFLGDAGESVTYSVDTLRRAPGGVVDFTISFTEVCSKEVPNTVGDEVALGWGETRTIKAPPGSWKVSLDSFDGQHIDFTDAAPKSPLLKVVSTPDSVTITAADPAKLVWPPAPAE